MPWNWLTLKTLCLNFQINSIMNAQKEVKTSGMCYSFTILMTKKRATVFKICCFWFEISVYHQQWLAKETFD